MWPGKAKHTDQAWLKESKHGVAWRRGGAVCGRMMSAAMSKCEEAKRRRVRGVFFPVSDGAYLRC
jgi:hypothetical protein